MKIEEISLLNFRNYRGEQRLVFTTAPDKNVTMVFGTNGGGKTTLLNACTWALFGELSLDFEEQETLINSEVWSEAKEGDQVPVSVTLLFEHDGKRHRVTRHRLGIKNGSEQNLGKVSFDVRVEEPGGAWTRVPNPTSRIEKILPSRLKWFFFINGERIENLAKPEAYSEIQSAIKTVVGIEPLERGVRHLSQARNKMRHKLRSEEDGEIAIDRVNSEIDDLQAEQKEKQEELDELKSDIAHLETELDSVDTRLRSLEGVAELQRSRLRFEELQKDAKAALNEQLESRRRLIRTKGFTAFLPGFAEQIRAACAALREKGQLPAPLKRTFVEDLLRDAECICGTHLTDGSPERAKIQEWLERAGLAQVEGAWMTLQGAMATLDDNRKSLVDELASADAAVAKSRKTLQEIGAELDEVTSKIKNLPGEDHARLEARRDELRSTIREKTWRQGAVQERLDSLASSLEKKATLAEKLEFKNAANKRIQHRIRVLREAEEALEKTRDLISQRTRRSLDARIRKVFERSSLKDYVPEITQDFELNLWIGRGDERRRAPKSTGENMLLSLAFVAALAEECRSVAQNDSRAMSDMSDFPVVLDAAFGNLDIDYRRRVADFLPKMASQVVVLTSRSKQKVLRKIS
ncbi:AAA family ATPase [Streptomyces flavalbus]|uniref:Nuclease SbcCD subunit C n=1 Tax=Streptomyces flavalbus TaxID=2665155 RepID=A0ABW2W8Z8_9ACTN